MNIEWPWYRVDDALPLPGHYVLARFEKDTRIVLFWLQDGEPRFGAPEQGGHYEPVLAWHSMKENYAA